MILYTYYTTKLQKNQVLYYNRQCSLMYKNAKEGVNFILRRRIVNEN